jgi:nitrate reductase gamma subunit
MEKGKGGTMGAFKMVAILLIAGGAAGLMYRGFSFTTESSKAHVGPVNVSVDEKHKVSVPVGVSVGAIVVGAGILLLRSRKTV